MKMKNSILTLATGLVLSISLSAQSDAQIEQLYQHYAKADETISFSFSHSILNAIDMDVDLERYTRNVEGDFETIRLIIFEKPAKGASALRKVAHKLKSWQYQRIRLEHKNSDAELQLFALKENGFYRHVVALINHRDDEEAILLLFTGKLTVKPHKS